MLCDICIDMCILRCANTIFYTSTVRILPGCLPRSLHTLDLSKNKIVVIEGLRELTRLRVLNLSHNRILRIGHGEWIQNVLWVSFSVCDCFYHVCVKLFIY